MRIRIFAIVAMLSLALATSAVAQTTPDQDAYGGLAGQEQADTGGLGDSGAGNSTAAPVSNTATPTETGSSTATAGGGLPFTGLQAGLMLAIGVGLVGTGVAVRRASRRGAQA